MKKKKRTQTKGLKTNSKANEWQNGWQKNNNKEEQSAGE